MYLHDGGRFAQVPIAPTSTPTAVLDQFDFDRSALKPSHLPEIDRIAKLVVTSQSTSDPITSVSLIGHTDTVGPANYNRALGLRRAHAVQAQLKNRIEDLKRGLGSRIKLNADTRGEEEPRPGSPARSRRVEIFIPRSVVPPPPPPSPSSATRDVKITVKSYIAPILGRRGATACSRLDAANALKLAALAAATDGMMSENPLTDVKDKGYRLFTSRSFHVVCSGGKIRVTATPLDTDVGVECVRKPVCFHPPPISVTEDKLIRTGPSTFSFKWTAKGRPARAVEPGFQAVCPRLSWFIWHSVSGTLDCSGPTVRVTTSLTGSHFPSHRLFLDGAIVSTIPQGPFSNLWVPKRGDITMVA